MKLYGRSSGKKGVEQPFLCVDCGESGPVKFYGKQKARCKKCHVQQTNLRRRNLKLAAIEYKGGRCLHCGYDKYYGALQFHHTDPTQKDPSGFLWNTFESVKIELDKCILLCANCHAEEHYRIWMGDREAEGTSLLTRRTP